MSVEYPCSHGVTRYCRVCEEAPPTGYVPASTRLAKWHRSQCNGDWEHMYGVKIETTDNPGWWVQIELDGTTAADITGKGKRDGMTWEIADGVLLGYDEETGNLEGLLCLLMDVIEAHNDQDEPLT